MRDFVGRVSALSAGALASARVGYLPLNDGFVRNRTPALWRSAQFARRHPRVLDPDALSRDVRACWEKVAGWFGHADAFDGAAAEPAVSFYCCNYFAVARANVKHHPRATWRWVYERLVVNHSCRGDAPDADRGKHEGGGAFEMLAALIWGGADGAAEYAGPNWRQLFGG